MPVAEREQSSGSAARTLLRRCLNDCQAMKMDDLVNAVSMDRATVARELGALVSEGEVEVLTPVTFDAQPAAASERSGGRSQHFRLIRGTDTDYLWEQELDVAVSTRRWRLNAHEAEDWRRESRYYRRGLKQAAGRMPALSYS